MVHPGTSLRRGLLVGSLILVAGNAGASEYKLAEEPPPQTASDIEGANISLFGQFVRRDRRVVFGPIEEWRKTKGPFIRDGQLNYNFRTYYFDEELSVGPESRAWAMGGELAYNSGAWRDTLALGASWYGSFELSGNSDAADSGLFSESGSNISVLGQAYVDLYWKGITGRFFRQELDMPYINGNDFRMIPNTFEAYGFGKRDGQVQFAVGHVTKIKTRTADKFVSMGEAAGVDDSDAGTTIIGLKWVSDSGNFDIGAVNQYTRNIFNTVYAEAHWKKEFTQRFGLSVAGQYTDQRSVGEDQIGDFKTDSWGVSVAGNYNHALLTLAITQTGAGGQILNPYGGSPSYLSMMISDFDRANEKARRVGLSYHFDRLGLPDVSFLVNAVKGRDARDPLTGTKLPDETEYDYTIDYKPTSGPLEGLWFRARYAKLREDGLGKVDDEIRLIVNYSLPIL